MTQRGERIRVAFEATAEVRVSVPETGAEEPRPCLVAVHGYGQPLDTFFRYACSLVPHAVVAMPEGPMSFYRERRAPDGRRRVGHAWIAETPRLPADERNDRYLLAALDAIAARTPIDPERTFLLAFSQGVGVALHFLLAHPERARGLVGLAGGLATPYRADLPRLAGKEVLWITGRRDEAYDVAYSAGMLEALGTSGAQLEAERLDEDHDLLQPAAARVRAWLAPRMARS